MEEVESILVEKRFFKAASDFASQANIADFETYEKMRQEAESDWEGFWRRHAEKEISWIKPFTTVYDGKDFPFSRWFVEGDLNISANCLDRHLEELGDKIAIIHEDDNGAVKRISYRELYEEVCRFANGLKKLGLEKGDRVIIYMPMHPSGIVAMQACARLGAIHSVVFAGFSAKSLRDRIGDAQAKWMITADEGIRGGKIIPLKKTIDEALKSECECVEKVIVYPRTGNEQVKAEMTPNRDLDWKDITKGQEVHCSPTPMNAEDTLFILYTSGSTGKPKGIQHSIAGYLLGCILSMRWVFDYKKTDIYWCTADIGWITGHSYVCYGPLAVGGTQVIFEGTPTYPHAGRFWEMIEKHKVTTFYTAPTAIRTLIKLGEDLPKKYKLDSLRLLGTVGEPINPEVWMWYHNTVGRGQTPIVDTWWQTETGSNMIAPIPAAVPTKPGSCTLPLPGIFADVIDENGNKVQGETGGYLVIKKPWPSQLRTIWDDKERFIETYYPKHVADGKYYVAGDSAHTDADGYFWILGRMDDVLNVSGHRLGTMEIESALVSHPHVVEAAVVSKKDDITGEAIVAFVVTEGTEAQQEDNTKMASEIRQWVTDHIGAIAKPKEIRFGDVLPKTRSGKTMRRLLRSIARGEEITQDISTLEDSSALEKIKTAH